MLAPTATFAEFAALNGWKRSYVTQLKCDGRLVLTEDGKGVRVAESLARIRDTQDPARSGVKARHAAKRAGATIKQVVVMDSEQLAKEILSTGAAEKVIKNHMGNGGEPSPPERAPEDGDLPPGDGRFQLWRARSEKARALSLERDNALAEGKLMDAGEVAAAVASATTTLRARLESLPDVLGPQLAAINDEAQARAVLADAIEHALEECSRQFNNLAKQPVQA